MPSQDSRELVAAASGGAQPAVRELVQRFLPRLQLFVRLHMGAALRQQEDSADLVQSVCVDLLSHLEGFRYEGEDKFVGWLFRAALNKVREKVRYHGRERRDPGREIAAGDAAVGGTGEGASLVERLPGAQPSPSRVAMGHEELARLEHALAQLPDDYRDVIVLARVVGLSHQEIAAQLGRTEVATRKLLGRAMAQLGQLTGPAASL